MRALVILIFALTAQIAAAQKARFKPVFTNHTEVGVLQGRVKYGYESNKAVEKKTTFTFQTFNGVRIRPRLEIGGTVGMDWYKGALSPPVAAGVRYDFHRMRTSRLYATADAGFGLAWFHEDVEGFKTKGGWMLNPGVGIRYGKPGGNAFSIGLSYKRQQVDVEKPLFWSTTVRYEDRVYNRIAMRIGMSF